ncbi:MAG: hypothetical protein ACOH5I_13015 [Oligoflexus sp.]
MKASSVFYGRELIRHLTPILLMSFLWVGCEDVVEDDSDDGDFFENIPESDIEDLSFIEVLLSDFDIQAGPRHAGDVLLPLNIDSQDTVQAMVSALTHRFEPAIVFPMPNDLPALWEILANTLATGEIVSRQATLPCDQGSLIVSRSLSQGDSEVYALGAMEYNDCILGGITYSGYLAASVRETLTNGETEATEDRFAFDVAGTDANGATVYSVLGTGSSIGNQQSEQTVIPLLEMKDHDVYWLAQDKAKTVELSVSSEKTEFSGRFATGSLGGYFSVSTPTALTSADQQVCLVSGVLHLSSEDNTNAEFRLGSDAGISGDLTAVLTINDLSPISYNTCDDFNGATGAFPGFLVTDTKDTSRSLRIANLTVDGDIDDWLRTNIDPVGTDPKNDQAGNIYTDLVAFYAAISGETMVTLLEVSSEIRHPHSTGDGRPYFAHYSSYVHLFSDEYCDQSNNMGFLSVLNFTGSEGGHYHRLEGDFGNEELTEVANNGAYLETSFPLNILPDGARAVVFNISAKTFYDDGEMVVHDSIEPTGCYLLP